MILLWIWNNRLFEFRNYEIPTGFRVQNKRIGFAWGDGAIYAIIGADESMMGGQFKELLAIDGADIDKTLPFPRSKKPSEAELEAFGDAFQKLINRPFKIKVKEQGGASEIDMPLADPAQQAPADFKLKDPTVQH